MRLNTAVQNVGGIISMQAGSLANRPAAGIPGRMYVRTDITPHTQFRDNGVTWIQIGGAGNGTVLGNGTIGYFSQWVLPNTLGNSSLVQATNNGNTVYYGSMTNAPGQTQTENMALDTLIVGNGNSGTISGGDDPDNTRITFGSFMVLADDTEILLNTPVTVMNGVIQTAPTNLTPAGQWKLGEAVATHGGVVVLDTTNYVSVNIGGTDFKLGLVV